MDTNEQVIARIAVDFEQAWQSGHRPVLQDFLSRVSDDLRCSLLQQLVPLDAEHRQKAGEAVSVDDYRELCESLGVDPVACLSNVIKPTTAKQAAQQLDVTGDYVAPELANSGSLEFVVDPGPTSAALKPGDEKPKVSHIGRYRIERILGRGGFGLVYLARDEQLDRRVAIKVPYAHLIANPHNVATYIGEARTVANLDHPHVVPVYDVGSTPDVPCFIVSKFIEGSDLASLLKQKRLCYRQAAQWIAAVAEALHYAHKTGLVHRDVKPGNILIGKDQQPYVVDFGLALREENMGQGPQYAGTPAYMSPEQARGEGHRVDGRSDIFSLGAVFYELLVGRRAFRGDTLPEIYQQIISYEPKPPRQYDEEIPKELERICHKALAKRATDRYSTAFDLAQDLRLFLQEHAQLHRGTSPATPAALPADHDTRSSGDSGRSPLPTPSTPATPALADSQPIKIVPKGLRSFDAHDVDFFLELLPGPRDREGLPDSLRFWKTRIEETDPDNTFSVGLIYGPSGCGKSSLVKAGLLPRLSADVVAVYVEATPDDTETRLLHGLRKRCPTLAENLSLQATSAALRRGQGFPVGKKVLIVLDQFEQWLHARKEEEDSELVQALRQCDGGRVQCIVMVRDDFWLAATRFMGELEVELLQGQNTALVDLFDLPHAQKVLTSFGRAFGTLPDNVSETAEEQKEFIQQTITGLAEKGKVICVRLALFAEMMKGKSWTPTTLKDVGGTKGIGVTFLEETFSSQSAHPKHRLHQKAARAVLKSLLPDSGADIKGTMRSYAELLEASGYGSRPKDFDDLIRILDSEIRLITPTDSDGKEIDDADSATETQKGQKYFQLTHDYLVHSLRDWLTRKQKETRKGRAELKLFDTSLTWNSKPENRFLPSLVDWLNIRFLTDRMKWTEPQRKMMGRAAKVHGMTWGGTLVAFLILGLSVQYWVSQRDWASKQQQTQIAAESLQNNLGPSIPVNIRELKKLPESLVLGELQRRFVTDHPRHKLAVALALAAYGQVETDYLVSRIDDIAPSDTANYVDALAVDRDRSLTALKAAAESCTTEALWRRKAKLAIAALALGDMAIAADMCQYEDRPDPGQRTMFIHEFPQWEWSLPERQIELSQLAKVVADSQDSALRSGISLGVGRLSVDQLRELNSAGLEAWQQLASRWYAEHVDTSTHSATIWLLRQWQLPVPQAPNQDQIQAERNWFVNSVGMTMLRIVPPPTETPPEPEIELPDPLKSYRETLARLRAASRGELSVGQRRSRAMAYFQTGDHTNALEELDNLLADEVIANNPGQLPAYRILSLARLERHDEAAAAYAALKETMTPSIQLYLEILLPTYRGDSAASLERLGGIRSDDSLGGSELYGAASAAALSARFLTSSHANFESYKTLALELLSQAIRAGYSNGHHLRRDPDFVVLHAESEFKSLVGKILRPVQDRERTVPESEYCIARCEVTRGQFEAFMQDSKYKFEKPTDWEGVSTWVSPTADHPAQQVSWHDAVMYCNWLSRREGRTPAYRKTGRKEKGGIGDKEYDQWESVADATGYRLPLEAEWEYACRAGSGTDWSSGSEEQLLADYCQMYPSKLGAVVGHKLPNAWGLQDMHGNVSEWCNDVWGGGSGRMLRGGGWGDTARNCRSAHWLGYVPALRLGNLGFRVALSFPGIPESPEADR